MNVEIYAKQVNPSTSTVNFFNDKFIASFTLEDGRIYEKEFILCRDIVPEQSQFSITRVKVLITLKKLVAGDWPDFEKK